MGLRKFIEYISKHFEYGDEEYPDDVSIKYVVDDNNLPSFFIKFHEDGYGTVYTIDQLVDAYDEANAEGYELKVSVQGLIIKDQEKTKSTAKLIMQCDSCGEYKANVVMFRDGNYCGECGFETIEEDSDNGKSIREA